MNRRLPIDFKIFSFLALHEDSQKYTVSAELHNAKEYWEKSLELSISGAEKFSLGCERRDANLAAQGIKLLSEAIEYVALFNREMKIAMA